MKKLLATVVAVLGLASGANAAVIDLATVKRATPPGFRRPRPGV